MKAHFSTAIRPFERLVRLAAPFGLVLGLGLGLSGPAHAVDGCKLLLCMAGNWQNISQCTPTVRQALREQGSSVGWLDPAVAEPPDFDENWAAVLMDDVHLYSTAQQATAFNWFVNAISPASGSQRWVLAAGNLPPADLPLRDDLRSRLGWGHVFQLQLLGEAERRAVLRQEADARGVFLGDEVMDYMLNRFSRDLGSLMQLLDQLDAFALRTQRAITIPLLKTMLESE